MKYQVFFVLSLLILSITSIEIMSQSVSDLYKNKNFTELSKYLNHTDSLSAEDVFFIGESYSENKEFKIAIELFNKAQEKGYNDPLLIENRAYSYEALDDYKNALKDFIYLSKKFPKEQLYASMIGDQYFYLKDFDSAIEYYQIAISLEGKKWYPYLNLPKSILMNGDTSEALNLYKEHEKLIANDSWEYAAILSEIGWLEKVYNHDYKKALKAYEKAAKFGDYQRSKIQLLPFYYYFSEYQKADSLFALLKKGFEKGELYDYIQKSGRVLIDRFEWNNQKIEVVKYFKQAKDSNDKMYFFYLYEKGSQEVERKFATVYTFTDSSNIPYHVLKSKVRGGDSNFEAYSWTNESISYPEVKRAVLEILNSHEN